VETLEDLYKRLDWSTCDVESERHRCTLLQMAMWGASIEIKCHAIDRLGPVWEQTVAIMEHAGMTTTVDIAGDK